MKENVLFNDALDTFYLNGVGHMVKNHSDIRRISHSQVIRLEL